MRLAPPLATLALGVCLTAQQPIPPDTTLVEAEAFADTGGWVVDQQFMDLMGSPMLLAHGLGEPVKDAATAVVIVHPGRHRVWVRTRDWVAPWNAPGAPGRFQLLVDGEALATTFGTEGAEWHWQDGGEVELGDLATLTLHDLTGFEGRCDAILLSRDLTFTPPDSGDALAALRGQLLGWHAAPIDGGDYDLVVCGGGLAGTAAAITAARLGCKVALVQDRPVLGGNGSSEVRVWPEGHTNHEPYPHVGDVVRELVRIKQKGDGNAGNADIYEDRRKLDLARAEPNLTLLLEHRVHAATCEGGHITAVRAQHTRSGRRVELRARCFADCTGDGVLGALVGADFEMTEQGHMGVSNLWNVGAVQKNEYQLRCECEDPDDPLSLQFTASDQPAPFPRCPWAVDLSDKPFPGRKPTAGGERKDADLSQLGGWFWETGFDRHPIADLERMRDQNLRAMYGAWDTLKNVDGQYPNQRLKWAAFLAGKRESRRLCGDVVVTGEDFHLQRPWPDAAFPCTWHIDLHFPKTAFQKGHEGDEFISDYTRGEGYAYQGPYWAPYRALYSRNVDNLFMAGRDISVTHEALGAVRVMQTCGMMGEVVGMAASLCVELDCAPRAVYADHLDELRQLLRRGAGRR
ncbi:MAG: FAD-dependent oxidoreductase [Planctomycetes bacterium]|nr:FAD-dependent oxidoreductase [Planctomycetota bacterium]